ncbi:uncharacterized protein LOC129797409 [Lutzomyia longipalpis]|uniref:uncharacterized protein LOC129797409 n=1 Tax=Lutzomyia longipalpis TaxID=7200 RepID=UPI0024833394|nr:uncharacterized protein LOC129797409 [Lutzomyia longipalpis]
MAETNGTIHFNKDEVNPPDFLNQEFFENVLQTSENDKALKITQLKLVPGTKPGDHFASIMFKAIISYTTKGKTIEDRSLVIKTMPVEEGIKRDMLKDMPIFDREIAMYTQVLPEMKRIMESIGDDEVLSPKLIYQSTDPLILIFDDITKHGYEMHYGFYDFDNTVKVLKKLAKYHALSFYMNDNKYNTSIDMQNYATMMSSDMFEKLKVFTEGFTYLADEVKNWPGYEAIAEKLATQNVTFMEKLIQLYQPNQEPKFNVLCHGDFHIKNMMFIKNGQDIDKTMFLDFQISFWGSPAIDLIYVFYAIGNAECRRRRGEILAIYHATLTEYLNRLGCLGKPPSLLELNMEVLKRGAMELLWAVGFLPFLCLDFTKIDMEAIVDPSPEVMGNMRRMMYKNEEIVKILREVLPDLLYKGILKMAETVENGKGPIQFNKDELTPPDFLNEEYFLNILRGVENDKALTITKFEMVPGTKPGDHFASIMFKAIVSYTSRGKVVSGRSLVVKTMPVEEGLKKEMFTEMPIFDREIDMYTKILPEMKRLMESIGDHEELAPRLLFHSTDPFVLIFEDITKFGYEMHAGFLDFDNTVKVALKLAKFHALSFYMNDNKYANKIDFPKYKGIMLTEKTIDKFQVFVDGLGTMAEEIKDWPGYDKIAEKVAKIKGTFLKTLLEAYKPNPEPGFNVLCHADFHIKNMMFIKNKEDIDKIFLLDFQMCFWGTPALDVTYLLYAIGNASVRQRRGELVRIYHNAFTDYLNRLGCLRKGPSLLELNIDLVKVGHLEILLGLCFLPFFCLDFTKVEMDAVIEPTPEMLLELQRMIYKNPEVIAILKEVLPVLLYKGVLDD